MLLILKNEVFAEGKVANRIKNRPPREARVSSNFPVSVDIYYPKIKQIMC